MNTTLDLYYKLNEEEEKQVTYLLEHEDKPVNPKTIKTYLIELFEYYLINYPNVFTEMDNITGFSDVLTYLLNREYLGTLGSVN